MFISKKELAEIKGAIQKLAAEVYNEKQLSGERLKMLFQVVETELGISRPWWGGCETNSKGKLSGLTKEIGQNLDRLVQYLGVELHSSPERIYYKKKENKHGKTKAEQIR